MPPEGAFITDRRLPRASGLLGTGAVRLSWFHRQQGLAFGLLAARPTLTFGCSQHASLIEG
jgi:hypothetical protein